MDPHVADLQELKDTLRNLSSSNASQQHYARQSEDTGTRVAAALAASGITMDVDSHNVSTNGHAMNLTAADLDTSQLSDFPIEGTTTAMEASLTSAHSSKAVLAALRALQGKIRRLEQERNTITSHCMQLKQKMRVVRPFICLYCSTTFLLIICVLG